MEGEIILYLSREDEQFMLLIRLKHYKKHHHSNVIQLRETVAQKLIDDG
ncbi:MAG: hypothetical protein ACMUEM_02230 [Flavobacteriales bacterium AspAUS03]